MADFRFNITEAAFKVEQLKNVVTDCATIYRFKVISESGNNIRISLDKTYQDYDNSFYTILGVDTSWDGTDITIPFGSDLYFSFSLSNSGTPGVFLKCIVEVWDDTTSEDYNFYTKQVVRQNDDLPCDDPTGQGGTYDELTDTPDNKVGQSLKLVRVSLDETKHEYVDPGTLGNDLNYTHVQASSISWAIPHNLGKIPSVTVIDGSGNRVHGDVDYVDLNNLTITFNTAFAGTAYLN